jgi:hypothetical protein
MPERRMGKFSKVIRNNPPPKSKKLLQNIPIATLMAVSIAQIVKVCTFLKIPIFVFLGVF